MSFSLKHPFTCIINAPSGGGKTIFALKLIENARRIINHPPSRVVWHYGIYQKIFDTVPDVEFKEGLPNINDFDGRSDVLIIIDDLMAQINSTISEIFTRGSHHLNLSVCFLTQNLFFSNKHMRTISLNTHYLVLFKNPRDCAQISFLSRQIYPEKPKFLVDAYRDATSKPYGYLFLDLKSDSDEKLRVLSDVFAEDRPISVYLPK